MAEDVIFDFEVLLKPISSELPSGKRREGEALFLIPEMKALRDESRAAEKRVREYRVLSNEDRADMEEAGHGGEPAPPDWPQVFEMGVEILEKHAKDLHVTAWLMEAATRRHGFAGVREGFRLARELCDNFWDSVHPRPEEDEDVTAIISQLSGLESTLPDAIQEISITEDTASAPRLLNGKDFVDSTALETSKESERKARIDRGVVTYELFKKIASETGAPFYEDCRTTIAAILSELDQFNETMEGRCGEDDRGSLAPPTRVIRETLEQCQSHIRVLTESFMPSPQSDESRNKSTEIVAVGNNHGPATSTGSVATREDAFRVLLMVSDFFRRTEPHSPVSYALEQAVRWGKMTLPELMTELIPDATPRQDLFRRTGIPEKE